MKPAEWWRLLRWNWIHLGPRRDVTIETANGLLSVDSADWLIGKYLYVRRGHELGEFRQAMEILSREGRLRPPGQTVLNVGANIGMTCIGLLKAGYFRRAIAIEPTPSSYRLLKHNIAQNGFSECIRSYPLALSSRSGTCEIEMSDENSGDNRVRLTVEKGFFHEERRRTVQAPVKTTDDFLAEYPETSQENIELVWVDVQGHEGHFFRGARNLLGRGVPVVSEFWPYGIFRSGLTEEDFTKIVSGYFTHFYVLGPEHPQKAPVKEVNSLFARNRGPRQMCSVVWIRDASGPAPS